MKAKNNFKPWTLEEVRAVINYPKTWAWAKALSKELGRSDKATAYINTAFNAWTRGNNRYMTPTLQRYFSIITDPKKNAQMEQKPLTIPAQKGNVTAAEIAELIQADIEEITVLFHKLGEAIVKEQYQAVNKELETQRERIAELEAELAELQQTKSKPTIKSLFNLT